MTGAEMIARIRFEHFQNRKWIKPIARERAVRAGTRPTVTHGGPELAASDIEEPAERRVRVGQGGFVVMAGRPLADEGVGGGISLADLRGSKFSSLPDV